MFRLLIVFVVVVGLSCSQISKTDLNVTNLKVEYLINPLGIDETKPRLSWVLESLKRNKKQSAYRILVASTKEKLNKNIGDLWDSGKTCSELSSHIVYNGKTLESRLKCFWKVCVWDELDNKTAFSEDAFWTMGLLAKSDWKARWIGGNENKPVITESFKNRVPGPPPPMFRNTFAVENKISSAIAYVTARGVYELYFNGKKVSNNIFAPGWTDYNVRYQYQTYDVTALLEKGKNTVGAIVGDGWYSGYLGWLEKRDYYGAHNGLLLQLELTFDDGSKQEIITDQSWLTTTGPILTSDMHQGEVYDARKEIKNWNTNDCEKSNWETVQILQNTDVSLDAQPNEPMLVTDYLPTHTITEPEKGVFVFDIGQNIAGWAKLKVKGEAGTKITMRFAERLQPDGNIYITNLRRAKATDVYILSGGKEEVYEPHFTFHGFQYVEVTGLSVQPDKSTITGCVVHSAMRSTGKFECSHPRVNKLWLNQVWGHRGNFISVPTDCPQRDERLGWMGDAQIFARTSAYNMDVAPFFTKWMIDINDAQSKEGAFADFSPRVNDEQNRVFEGVAGWGDAGVIIPWTMYLMYGDTRVIKNHYEAMVNWLDYIHKDNPNFLRKNRLNNNYGDWLSIKANTPKDLLATAYWAYDADLLSKMAKVIGKEKDAAKFSELFQKIKTAFQKEYITPNGRIQGDTQTGYVLALYMNLFPENLRTNAVEFLIEDIKEKGWHLSTGFIGVRHLNLILSQMGFNQVGYQLLLQDTFPSWFYPIKNGATTIWERWDGWTEEKGFQDPGMNSFNHYSLGSIGEWLYSHVAGINCDPEQPGFKHIIIRPYPGKGLDFANAEYNSIHGKIKSDWKLDGNQLKLNVTIPANTKATVFLPSDKDSPISESGKRIEDVDGVELVKRTSQVAVLTIGSGSYSFQTNYTL
jgi:alpha-L-rhamnosidase